MAEQIKVQNVIVNTLNNKLVSLELSDTTSDSLSYLKKIVYYPNALPCKVDASNNAIQYYIYENNDIELALSIKNPYQRSFSIVGMVKDNKLGEIVLEDAPNENLLDSVGITPHELIFNSEDGVYIGVNQDINNPKTFFKKEGAIIRYTTMDDSDYWAKADTVNILSDAFKDNFKKVTYNSVSEDIQIFAVEETNWNITDVEHSHKARIEVNLSVKN